MPHLDSGRLHALLDGEIPSTELPPLQHHLATCAECRARLDEERALMEEADTLVEVLEVPDAPRRAPASRPTAPRGLRPRWSTVAWAAAVVLALGIGYAARGSRESVITVPATELKRAAEPTGGNTVALAESAATPAVSDRREAVQSAAPRVHREPATTRPEERRPAAVLATTSGDSGASRERAAGSGVPPVVEMKAAAAPAPRPPAILGGAVSARALQQTRLDEVVTAGAADAARSKSLLEPAPVEISFTDAMQRLGGTLRLIEGLVPRRLEAAGNTVRVVYPYGAGTLILSQQRIDNRVTWSLRAEPALPADTLAALRARVRE